MAETSRTPSIDRRREGAARRCRHAFPALRHADEEPAGAQGGAELVAAMLPTWADALSRALRTAARAPLTPDGAADIRLAPLPDLIAEIAGTGDAPGAVPVVVRPPLGAPPVVLIAEPALVGTIVDLFFGGTGIAAPVRRDAPTPVERARLMALGARFAAGLGGDDPAMTAGPMEADDASFAEDRPLGAAAFAVRLDPRPGAGAGAGGRIIGRIILATPAGAGAGGGGASGPMWPPGPMERLRWRQDLARRMADVRLPIRAVLSRPMVSVGDLGALRPGDSIPLAIPRHVPLLIEGIRIGAGMLGEVEGTSAVRIDQPAADTPPPIPRLAAPTPTPIASAHRAAAPA